MILAGGVRPRRRSIDHEPEGFHLLRGPLVAEDDWDRGNPQFAGGLEAQMAVNHLAVTSHQTWNLRTKFTNAGAHAIHRPIVLARVAGIKNLSTDQVWISIDTAFGIAVRRFSSFSFFIESFPW